MVRNIHFSRVSLLLASLLITLLFFDECDARTYAATHAPCVGHAATAPYVTTVDENVTTIHASGGISGCPIVTTTAGESVTITTTMQRFNKSLGVWVDKASNGPVTKGWNRYWRYARALYVDVDGICQVGDWRTRVEGGDGFEPFVWYSATVTFRRGDSGVCGTYGGGDRSW